jgi:hypothetical protein
MLYLFVNILYKLLQIILCKFHDLTFFCKRSSEVYFVTEDESDPLGIPPENGDTETHPHMQDTNTEVSLFLEHFLCLSCCRNFCPCSVYLYNIVGKTYRQL